MKTIQILDWTVHCDPEATRAAHAAMSEGSPEQCRCKDCLNFMAGRHLAYPPAALEIFAELGILSDRESSVGGSIRLPSDSYQYNGWFHFVGHLEEGPEPRELVADIPPGEDVGPGVVQKIVYQPLTENFEIGLIEKRDLLPSEFKSGTVVQFEFLTELPWMIDEPPD